MSVKDIYYIPHLQADIIFFVGIFTSFILLIILCFIFTIFAVEQFEGLLPRY